MILASYKLCFHVFFPLHATINYVFEMLPNPLISIVSSIFLNKITYPSKKKNEKKKIASDFCYALLNLNKWVSFHFVSRLICCMMIHPEYNLNSFLWFKKLFLSGWLSISSAPHLLNLLQLKILVPNSHHCKLVSLFREIPSCIFLSMSWYCFYFKW